MKVGATISTSAILCPNCRYRVEAKKLSGGSFALEMVLLTLAIASVLVGISASAPWGYRTMFVVTGIFVGLIWLSYALWRHSTIYYGCPECNWRLDQVFRKQPGPGSIGSKAVQRQTYVRTLIGEQLIEPCFWNPVHVPSGLSIDKNEVKGTLHRGSAIIITGMLENQTSDTAFEDVHVEAACLDSTSETVGTGRQKLGMMSPKAKRAFRIAIRAFAPECKWRISVTGQKQETRRVSSSVEL